MPIIKKKNSKGKTVYIARVNYTDASGKYRSTQTKGYPTAAEAKQAEALLKAEKMHSDKFSITFNEIHAEYVTMKKDKVKPQTLRKEEDLWKHIEPVLGNTKIEKLTINQYRSFKESLPEEMATVRKNRIHQYVKALVKHAYMMYGINSVVPDRVGGFSDPNKPIEEMQFYTHEEFLKYIDVANRPYKELFTVLYYQGLRKGEANALTWKDIDFDNRRIKITKSLVTKQKGVRYSIGTPKTKSSYRTIPMHPYVQKCLEELKEYYKDWDDFKDDWFVFGGIYPLHDTSIDNANRKHAEMAKLKRIRIHDFRHSCASYYIHKGGQIVLISKFLGHKDISITLNVYSHMYPSDLDDLVFNIEKA